MKNQIRVLHTEWSDGWGGQEIRIINEMLALQKKGVQTFLACRKNSQIYEKATECNIPTFTLQFRSSFDLKTIYGLYLIIKKNKINIVNTHSGKDTWVGGFAAKLAQVKFIRTRHLSNKINPSRFNFINELADFIFTTGESVRESMIKNNRIQPARIVSIPTGADQTLFDPKKYNKVKERIRFNINDNDIAIGIIAVLRQVKRHDLFIKSAYALLKKYPNLKFFIAGNGPQKEILETLVKNLRIEKNIIFLGHVNNPANLLAALDIFVLTSSNEGVPQSVIQALLMEKNIVATDAGSTKDLYFNNNFLLIQPDNQSEIEEKIEYLINNPTKLKTQRDLIVKKFSIESMSQKIYNIYKEILSYENFNH